MPLPPELQLDWALLASGGGRDGFTSPAVEPLDTAKALGIAHPTCDKLVREGEGG